MCQKNKLILRAIEPTDVDFLYASENDSSAWDNADTAAPLSRSLLREYALNYEADPFRCGQLRLVVALTDDTPIGLADLYEISPIHRHAYVGIYISSPYRRNGYAIEALRMLANYTVNTLHLSILAARVPADNHPSVNLFSKASYTLAGRMRNWISRKNNRSTDQLIFTLNLSEGSSTE